MLKNVTIKNFQSLHEVDLDLGAFTVIVGPSSSGKSALTRALKTIAGNARGTAFIENGQSDALITAENESHRVTLVRSNKSTGANEYRVMPLGDYTGAAEARYTKLGGSVPPEVSQALRMAPDPSAWLAGQFDRPFLLAESGGEVARTLGALTNVSVIFEAAREANRRRGVSSQTLKTRKEDSSRIKESLKAATTLKDRAQAVKRAEEALDVLSQAQHDLEDLERQWQSLGVGASALKEAKRTAGAAQGDLDKAKEAWGAAVDLRDTWAALVSAAGELKAAQQRQSDAAKSEAAAQQEYDQTLHAMGKCPTCGQKT